MKCKATNSKGKPCGNKALPGSAYCGHHQDQAPEAPPQETGKLRGGFLGALMAIESIQIGGVGVKVRSWQAVVLALVLLVAWWLSPMIFGGADKPTGTGDATVNGMGNANTGTQNIGGDLNIGLTPTQVRQAIVAYAEKDSTNAKRAAELDQQIDRLSAEMDLRKPAVENFLRILGEAKVPIEDLAAKLAEIAQRHKDMLDRWSIIEEDDDPAIRQLTDAARAAINDGDYDRADSLLAEAEEMDLAVANQRFISAASKRAKRGELRLTRLDYPGAAKHFKAAAAIVPAGHELVLAGYLMREGSALEDAGKYWEAEESVKRALVIREKALGPDHPDVAASLNNLALLYYAQGRYSEAEPLYQRDLAISEKALGPDHPHVAASLNNLAVLYYHQGEYQKAAASFVRIIGIDEKTLGADHPTLALHMENYAIILTKLDRTDEAAHWSAKAEAIRKSGPD